MSFSFTSLVRLIVILTLSSVILAIGFSRLDPPGPDWRTRVASRYVNLNEFFLNSTERTPRWLDSETGRVVSSPLADGDVLEAASCSPWVDEKGRYQVAGRWSSRTSMGPMSISTDFGLARYSFPDGHLLDHVSTEIVPVGPPCWFPGTRARILFAAGDGLLYHYAFEAEPHEKELAPEARREPAPIALTWRCPKPGLGKVFLSDVTWPQDPRLTGYLIVGLREQLPDRKFVHAFTGTNLWWLKLNYGGTEIVEVGRLLMPPDDSDPNQVPDSRSPTVGTLPDGRMALAYLTEIKKQIGWELRVAPIELEGDQNVPRAWASKSIEVSRTCQPTHPGFSPDGRWLNTITDTTTPSSRILRISLPELFPRTR